MTSSAKCRLYFGCHWKLYDVIQSGGWKWSGLRLLSSCLETVCEGEGGAEGDLKDGGKATHTHTS